MKDFMLEDTEDESKMILWATLTVKQVFEIIEFPGIAGLARVHGLKDAYHLNFDPRYDIPAVKQAVRTLLHERQ